MVLSRGDEYPIHQTPEPVAYSGTDRNFYDRYFFNGYAPDGGEFFALAFGVYPHLDVADAHKCYRESDIFTPGDRVVTAETPFGRLGLSICYDVRFPHLYSELRKQGAQIIVVPAAFTAVTGQAHWEALLRCRAIETQSWIVAVGQGGKHPCQRETWGHSMVVDPWGRVIAQLDQDPKSMVVEIDTSSCESIRQNMPIAQHSRFTNQF